MGIIQTDKAFVLSPYSTPVPGEDVNPGYTFEGWNTKADGTGDVISGGVEYRPSNDIALYAQWKRKEEDAAEDADGNSSAFAGPSSSGTRTAEAQDNTSALRSGNAGPDGNTSRRTFDLSGSRRWIVPYGGEPREVLRVKDASGAVLWEKYYRVSYEANIDADAITAVDAVLEGGISE